jgi:hypothetical protein
MAKQDLSNITLATQLFAVQAEKTAIEAREKELKDALLASLTKQGVGFVRLDNGTSFTRSHRETLKVKDEEKARAWAEENYCLKIDTTKAMKILRREMKMPKFFTRVIGEDYLTVKRPNDTGDDNN